VLPIKNARGSLLVDAGGRHVELRLRARDRRTLTLDRKAVLLEIAGGEVRTNAGITSPTEPTVVVIE
jgi:hypothetical protein